MSLLSELRQLLIEEPWSDELPEDWKVIDCGDWYDSHKSESKCDIIQHIPTGKFYRVDFYRTGDHWQGYETEFVDACEVEPYQKTITAYRVVKLLAVTEPAMSVAKVVSDE